MANLLAQLLQGSSYAYQRSPCVTMDSSSTTLPAASTSPLTVNGVLLNAGDRVLYTALTTNNNEIYVMVEDSSTGRLEFYMSPATDGRGVSGTLVLGTVPALATPGQSTKFDMVLVEDTELLWVYSGTSWTNMDSL